MRCTIKAVHYLKALTLFYVFSCVSNALAWSDHGRLFDIMSQGIENSPQWNYFLNSSVQYESLEAFLKNTENLLPQTLADIEAWSIANEPDYKPIPQNLKYSPTECRESLEICFKKAIRVNTGVPLTNYIEDYRDEFPSAVREDLRNIELENISTADDKFRVLYQAKKLADTDSLLTRQVLSTFVDEPDHGLDINLYDDNPPAFPYNFGTQPIGVTYIPYVSQFLFHVGTYQECYLVKLMSPRLKESYPAYRSHLYFELARFAKRTGHPYWAMRFAAWGLHYVQDLTQPYHSTLFPDYTSAQMMFWFTQNALGYPANYTHAKNIIANRHTIIETMLAHIMIFKLDLTDIIASTLKINQQNDALRFTKYNASSLIREQVSKETAAIAPDFVTHFVKSLPQQYISNADFNVAEFSDYNSLFLSLPEEAKKDLLQTYAQRLKYFSLYSQVYLLDFLAH